MKNFAHHPIPMAASTGYICEKGEEPLDGNESWIYDCHKCLRRIAIAFQMGEYPRLLVQQEPTIWTRAAVDELKVDCGLEAEL